VLLALLEELLHEMPSLLIKLVLINSVLLLIRPKNLFHPVSLFFKELHHFEVHTDGLDLDP
jgi:hypothetical protein